MLLLYEGGHKARPRSSSWERVHLSVGRVAAASRFEDTRLSLSQSLSGAMERRLLSESDGGDCQSRALVDQLQSQTRLSTLFGIAGLTAWMTTALQLVDFFSGVNVGTVFEATGGAGLSSTHWITAKGYRHLWASQSAERDHVLTVKAICKKELGRMERRVQEGVPPYALHCRGTIEIRQTREWLYGCPSERARTAITDRRPTLAVDRLLQVYLVLSVEA
jgi:hypothetical protein